MKKPFAAPPDVLRWVSRSQGHGDCAVAALALATGTTYETTLSAIVRRYPTVLTEGLTLREMQHVLRDMHFGSRVRTRTFDADEDTGILSVTQPHVPGSDHVVYLWEGRVIEPKYDRQELWLSARDFLSHYKYTATHLMTVTRKDAK